MKKTVSLFLVISLIAISIFCVPFAAQAKVNFTSGVTDFESGTLPATYYGTIFSNADETRAASKQPIGGNNYFMPQILKENKGTGKECYDNFGSPLQDILIVEGDFWIPEATGAATNAVKSSIAIQFGTDTGYATAIDANGNAKNMYLCRFQINGTGKFRITPNNGQGNFLFNTQKWYRMKFIIDKPTGSMVALIKPSEADDSAYQNVEFTYFSPEISGLNGMKGTTYYFNGASYNFNAGQFDGSLGDDITRLIMSREWATDESYVDNYSVSVLAQLHDAINRAQTANEVYNELTTYSQLNYFDFGDSIPSFADCEYSCSQLLNKDFTTDAQVQTAFDTAKKPFEFTCTVHQGSEKLLYQYNYAAFDYTQTVTADGYLAKNVFDEGNLIADIAMKNNSSAATLANIAIAQYKDGELIAVSLEADTVAANDSKTISTLLDIKETNDTLVKVLCFNKNTDIKPLQSAIVLQPRDTQQRKLFLISDSICAYMDPATANYINGNFPYQGWGIHSAEFLDDAITVENDSLGGWSTKCFLEGPDPVTGPYKWATDQLWKNVLPKITANDTVFLCLGINDTGSYEANGTPLDQYKTNLKKFADDTHAKGAEIIFSTITIKVGDTARPEFSMTDYEDRNNIIKEVAAETNSTLIDLTTIEYNYLTNTALKYNLESGHSADSIYGYTKLRDEFFLSGTTIFKPVAEGGYGLDFAAESALTNEEGANASAYKKYWLADANGFPILDSTGNPTYKYDPVHPNIDSSRILAELIFDAIRETDTKLASYVKIPYTK